MSKEDTYNTKVIRLISLFRAYYKKLGYEEINRMPLVSGHDRTIRFTNSTSSVMKPYYTNGAVLMDKIMLMQPAIGCQGINSWIREKEVGCFSSYFLSFGVMCYFQNLKDLISDSIYFFSHILQIDMDNFCIQYTEKFKELSGIIEGLNVNICKERYNDAYYIHHFGIDGLIGKTACYTIKNHDEMRYVGSVIVLEQDGKPVAIEHSFDSTLLLAALREDGHPVEEMAGVRRWNSFFEPAIPFKVRMAFFDLLNVSVVFVMEGLKTGSRGRRENLRTIIKEISRIISEYNSLEKSLSDIIQAIVTEEKDIRVCLVELEVEKADSKSIVDYLLSEIEKYLNIQI